MARELHYRERRMLRCIGMTARAVAAAEQMRVDEVLEIRADLRARGLLPPAAGDQDTVTVDAAAASAATAHRNPLTGMYW